MHSWINLSITVLITLRIAHCYIRLEEQTSFDNFHQSFNALNNVPRKKVTCSQENMTFLAICKGIVGTILMTENSIRQREQ